MVLKKVLPAVAGCFIMGLTVCSTAQAGGDSGKWILYDNFNSGHGFMPAAWNKIGHSGDISISHGAARFVHYAGFPGQPQWLSLRKGLKRMTGIRMKVTVGHECSGKVRTRIRSYFGRDGARYNWGSVELRPGENTVAGFGQVIGPNNRLLEPLGEKVQRLNIGGGQVYRLSLAWGPTRASFRVTSVQRFGMKRVLSETIFFDKPLQPSDQFFTAIGTVAFGHATGPCTVFVDDVEIRLPRH